VGVQRNFKMLGFWRHSGSQLLDIPHKRRSYP